MISLIYLLFNITLNPFCNLQLNRTQTFLVFMNMFTLFIGFMSYLANFVDKMHMRNGSLSKADNTQKNAITAIIFLSNIFVLAAPPLLKFISS